MAKFSTRLYTIYYLLLLWSCASQTTPMGGPKDEDPPDLLSSKPIHKQRNFKGKSIELLFDEPVDLYNPKEEILISPSVGKDVDFKVRKNTVTISPANGWEENTTYSISFRDGIKDITENNAPINLRLAFSTGPLIDSLLIQGKVKLALKESIPENITVALYKSDTFNIFDHTPTYFTISSKSGEFSLENIKDDIYHIYAFEDKNKNLKVESRTEKYGFLADPIILNGPTDSLSITLVNLDSRPLAINNIRNNGLYTTIKFNKNLNGYSLYEKSPETIINSYGDNQSEIVIYNPKTANDSLAVTLSAIDSVNFQIDTTFYIKSFEAKFIPSDFTLNSNKLKYNLEKKELLQILELSKPIHSLNLDSIGIKVDSTTMITFTKENFSYDSILKLLTIKKVIPSDSLFRTIESTQTDSLKSKLDPNKKELRARTKTLQFKPELILGFGAVVSIESDSSKARKFEIPFANKNNTGTLLIQTMTNKPHYVIQLLNTGGEIIEEVRDIGSYTFTYLPAGNYRLKVIIDNNNNGIWDPGNIFKWEEPEQIFIYQTADKKYDFPIRANWELGPLMLIF
ncbi:MAG TPA: Ig-like domain-containing protein [Cyclobacteriaceae bacterium]